jgi:uncharacterized protein (TIGR03437 family)
MEMKLTRCLLALAGLPAFAQPVTLTYSYNGLPLPILTDAAETITVASVYVPRSLKTTKVTAQVQIQYPNSGDLKVYLFSPLGTRTILLEHDCSVVNIDTTFDDSAQSLWKDFCPSQAGQGPFRPDQPLSNFNSDDSSFGTWTLWVENDASDSRSGWLTTVSLTITGTPLAGPTARPTTVVNAASYQSRGVIAPGELVSIFGVGLGPQESVSAPSGNLPTSLGGTSVTIGGAAVPIAYASFYRVDFQAPFSLSPGSTETIQITSNNVASTGVQVNVVAAAPGLFTRSMAGAGQVMAANQSGSTNSAANQAARGSTISMYASGLGVTSPVVAAGTAPPSSPLSTVSGVEAFIAGVSATVQFAGLAPGVPGLYQLNIQIPANVPSGAQELMIFASGQSSQRGATIQIQ